MNSLNEMSKKHYDVAVFGADLTSLSLAYLLSKKYHLSVALLDPADELAKVDMPVMTMKGPLPSHLQLIPDNEQHYVLLKNFLHEIGFEENLERCEIEPLTFEGGQFKPFVGFGSRKLESSNWVMKSVKEALIHLKHSPSEWVEFIKSQLLVDSYSLASLTDLTLSEEGKSTRVVEAIVNGSQPLKADHFIYCLSGKSLTEKFRNHPFLPNKIQGLFSKTKLWGEIQLHLSHTHSISEHTGYQVLLGGKDDFEPCFGHFFGSSSLWTTFVPQDLMEDSEYLTNIIRNMKRQLKRPYPDILDQIHGEKIVVHPEREGFVDLQFENFGQLSSMKNFYVCHSTFVNEVGLIAQIKAVLEFLNDVEKTIPDLVSKEKEAYLLALSQENNDSTSQFIRGPG